MVWGWNAVMFVSGIASVVVPFLTRDVTTLATCGVIAVFVGIFWGLRVAGPRSVHVFRILVSQRYARHRTPGRLLAWLVGITDQKMEQHLWRAARSLTFVDADGASPNQPLLVPIDMILSRPRLLPNADRRPASTHRSWKGWAFAVRITRAGMTVVPSTRENQQRKTVRFALDPHDEGVYSNMGKRYLQREFARVRAAKSAEVSVEAEALYDFGLTEEAPVAKGFPLRWASAGALPVVTWQGRRWVALFFRDIHPIGWNVANGASETAAEQVEIDVLAHREFCEELLAVTGPADHEWEPVARPFVFDGSKVPLSESRSFSALHRELREQQDGVSIRPGVQPQHKIPVTILGTPWDTEVVLGERSSYTDRVIPSINPSDHGIELIKVVSFRLGDDDLLLDGEIFADTSLVRRPVGLFAVDALKRVNVGEYPRKLTRGRDDQVLLPPLEDTDFHIFRYDIEWRLERRDEPGSEDAKQWLNLYEAAFDEPGLGADVRMLCPVTWRTLKAALDAPTVDNDGNPVRGLI